MSILILPAAEVFECGLIDVFCQQIFCVGLMQEPRTQVFKDFEFKDRMFLAIVDIITLAIFQGTLHPGIKFTTITIGIIQFRSCRLSVSQKNLFSFC